MRWSRLHWRLFSSYLLILVASLLPITWYATKVLHDSFAREMASSLEADAILLKSRFQEVFLSFDYQNLDAFCKQTGREISRRITVVLPSGQVVADSDADPARMDNHSDRPEIAAALSGKQGFSQGYSRTLHEETIYVAMPIEDAGKIVAAVRVAVPVSAMNQTLKGFVLHISLGAVAALLVASGASWLVSRRISGPLEDLREGADRFARGEFEGSLPLPDTFEFRALGQAMNLMAKQLTDRILSTVHQKNELEAILSSMAEGVFTVDTNERILSVNRAAALMLGLYPDQVQGRSIQETIRNADLQRFVREALVSEVPVERDVVLRDREEVFLDVHGALLRDSRGSTIGAVIVLHDQTKLMKLERVRREFVANVSHELRTPITAIKGYAETLLDGAMRDPEDAQRFLQTIAKHAGRLNALIEDLLLLSRMEQGVSAAEVGFEEVSARDVLQSATEDCLLKAEGKGIRIELSCPSSLMIRVNPSLIEQAVINLIDNAIQYSESGSVVWVEAFETEREVLFVVRDEGCGIEREHLPRLFERFYRVDRSRSRKLGGTGLGLSIVKHIVQVHKGRVEVESVPGVGSAFTIHLVKKGA